MRSLTKYFAILIFILICLLINLAGFMEGQDWGDDFAGYIIQAQTLVNGDFDKLQYNILRNDFILNYPWGFPMLLTPVIEYFPHQLIIIKAYIFIYFLLSLVVFYFIFCRQKLYVLLAILLIAAGPYFWFFKNYLFSDYPNLLFVLLSLLCIQTFINQKKKLFGSISDHALLGFFLFLAFFMRTQSVVLLIVLFTMQLVFNRRELLHKSSLLIALIPYAVFLILHFLSIIVIPVKPISYLSGYVNLDPWQTIWNNIFYYTGVWSELFHETIKLQEIKGEISGVVIFLFITGICKGWRNHLIHITFIISLLGVVLLSPFYQGLRYLLPAVPMFFFFAVKGLFEISEALFNVNGRWIAYGSILAVCLFFTYTIGKLSFTNYMHTYHMDGPFKQEAKNMFEFLRKNILPGHKIAFWKPRAMLLFSERNSVIANNIYDCKTKNADYYVYYKNAYTDQMLLDSLENFRQIYNTENFKIFKVGLTENPAVTDSVNITSTAGTLIRRIDYQYFNKEVIYGPENMIALWSNTAADSKQFDLQAGNYTFAISSRGTPADGQEPVNQLVLNGVVSGTFRSRETPTLHKFKVKITKNTPVILRLQMLNDLIDKKGGDRNTFVYYIDVFRSADTD